MRSNILVVMAAIAVSAGAQDIISARAGLIHYMEGAVLVNGEALTQNGDTFVSMKQGETLSTERGRAEVLLNAGTYLRIGEASSFKLVAADLENTQITLLSGQIMIEVADLPKDTSATLDLLGSRIALKKRGLYEFRADAPGKVRVYDGELALTAEGATPIRVTKGREIAFNKLSAGSVKFDLKETSELYNWGSRRAIYIAQANESAARTAYTTGTNRSALASSLGLVGPYQGVWVFNPYYGMYTFLPVSGWGYSPYGIRLFSPLTYYSYVMVPTTYTGYSGNNTASVPMQRSSVSSDVYTPAATSSAGAVATPAATAPAVETPNTGGGGDAGRRR